MPRMERARRPPEAESRAHIPRAIASREAMLWQGCSLSPRELERKAPRSVWATQLPASRPIRWIARESREANRTDSPALGIPSPAFLSDKLRSRSRTSIGRTRIGNPLARIPSDGLRDAPRASTDGLARFLSDGLRDAPRASTDGLARFLSDKLRSRSRTSIGRTRIGNPLARFPTDGLRPH